jgi:hypothetical protein
VLHGFIERRRLWKTWSDPNYYANYYVAAPTFFWGGEAARATGGFIATRLILMGVWRDSSQP